VIDAGIGLRVCNTFHPELPGTRVLPDNHPAISPSDGIGQGANYIKAVTAIHKQSLITVEGRGMLGVPGVAARTFGAVASTGTSVPLITQASSEQSICFAVPLDTTSRVIASLEIAFSTELNRGDIDRIWASEEVTIITIVGAGMRSTPGIAGRIFTALGENRVNVIAIAQGSSEVSISLVVDAKDADQGVRAVHDLIVDRKSKP
jgi:aspartate kinase